MLGFDVHVIMFIGNDTRKFSTQNNEDFGIFFSEKKYQASLFIKTEVIGTIEFINALKIIVVPVVTNSSDSSFLR